MARPPFQKDGSAIITSKARDVFARYGFSKATMDDIAKAVGLKKSSLYYYFKNKEDVIRAVLEAETAGFKDRILRAMDAVDNPRDKFRAYVLTRMKAMKDLVLVYHSFREEYLNNYAFIQRMREGYDRYEYDLIVRLLREGNRTGMFNVKDIPLMGSTLVAVIKGLEVDWSTQMDAAEIERSLDQMLGVLFYGIVKR